MTNNRNIQLVYRKCKEVDDESIYQAFQSGFSDYMVKMELSKEDFLSRFFGPEGNSLDHSFIAFSGEEPVGVILGGIKNYEGIQTMRCGTLAIHPSYRGSGISQHLFALHKEEALKYGCKQLFLEVIVGNDRAIHFYKKLGYEKIYDLSYFTLENCSVLQGLEKAPAISIQQSNFETYQQSIRKWDYHINWQNDRDYLVKLPDTVFYSALDHDVVIGQLAIHPKGKISFLMVDKEYRGRGVGSMLLKTAADDWNPAIMSAGFPNNHLLEGFLKKIGFQKQPLTQYEMYLTLLS